MPAQTFNVASGDWTDLGPTPVFVQLASTIGGVLLTTADAKPAATSEEGVVLSVRGEASANLAMTGSRAWVRKIANSPPGPATIRTMR